MRMLGKKQSHKTLKGGGGAEAERLGENGEKHAFCGGRGQVGGNRRAKPVEGTGKNQSTQQAGFAPSN